MLVLFDFGEVLGLPQTLEDRRSLAAGCGLDLETFDQRYWAHRHAYDSGDLTDAAYWSAIADRTLETPVVTGLARLDTDSWLHLSDPVIAIHADLVARGIPTALFSNAPGVIADAIDALPPFAPMRGRYFSARLRLAKPDPAAFAAVLTNLAHRPQDVVFVDDRPVNVAGAEAAGLRGVLFTGPEHLRADLARVLDS
ncbi:putative hydrolase of the HAD superfamily [Raineyella antarctica]|uniref:Putative hydrolase of the HAD superfamily n=1 Tax=Raineyella antarctica TaxID=1577474 RepID=A0A1G6GFT1_9ACTN|nr:HAD-IA family hydrolase [Raineyella antarctica]SDB80036.1 putative hydrolase of the HAD superfamily [Raineyella antarctica]